jgi:general secretion pathway protein G
VATPPTDGRTLGTHGFTIIELLTTMVILGILAGIVASKSKAAVAAAKVARAIGDIRTIQAEIQAYEIAYNGLPAGLVDIGRDRKLDPWGRPYAYLRFAGRGPVPPGARRDTFLVPINSSFDLYSLGADGQSAPPLTARRSHDDVVRGNDGGFIGLGRKF